MTESVQLNGEDNSRSSWPIKFIAILSQEERDQVTLELRTLRNIQKR